MHDINRILVVGGGTSGWLSAAILAKTLGSGKGGPLVTLVESPHVSPIGVGEGTIPTLVETMAYLGIDEEDLVVKCSATFKQAIKFVDWVHPPHTTTKPFYYHLFENPVRARGVELVPCWLRQREGRRPFASAVSHQALLCDRNSAPRAIGVSSYKWNGLYAYHLDAGKVGELLKNHCLEKLGVKHLLANVDHVKLDESGFISSVETREEGTLEADFFIDCTGFASILLGKALAVDFLDYSNMLFVDNAVAMRVPNAQANQAIPSVTIATAQQHGWTWDIGLSERRGVGYVYSSKYTDHDTAESLLRQYVGSQAESIETRRIPMKVGRRSVMWKNNCVGIGFASGFAEPLEATAIAMVEAAALSLATRFPRSRAEIAPLARQYNKIYSFRWDTLFDFIKLHYCITKREDTPFWVDNANVNTVSERLRDLLELWRFHPPTESDISDVNDMFRAANYQYVLYGMEFETDVRKNIYAERQMEQAAEIMRQVQHQAENLVQKLPTHRELISEILGRKGVTS